MVRTNEILASKHGIASLKVKQGHFETSIFVVHNFVVLRLKVFRSIRLKYLHYSNSEYSDAAD